jgi:hypothetical protein
MPANNTHHIPAARVQYRYNPACVCELCARGGQEPKDHPELGHSLCYGLPHVPPYSRPPWPR